MMFCVYLFELKYSYFYITMFCNAHLTYSLNKFSFSDAHLNLYVCI